VAEHRKTRLNRGSANEHYDYVGGCGILTDNPRASLLKGSRDIGLREIEPIGNKIVNLV